MRYFAHIIIAVTAALFVCAARAQPAPTVTVMAVDPDLSDGPLGNFEALYIKFSYRTAQKVLVEIAGLSDGRRVPGMMSGGIFPASPGSGEHALWITYKAGTTIDGLRVSILDPRERPISSFDLPAHLSWLAMPHRAMNDRPQWVQQQYRDDQRPTPMAPPTTMEVILGMGAIYGIPLFYLLMQASFGLRWTGGWRKSALVPLLLMVPAFLWSVYAFADGSNVAPLPVVFATLPSLVYLAILWLARTVTLRLAT